jgi:hypothetical protein
VRAFITTDHYVLGAPITADESTVFGSGSMRTENFSSTDTMSMEGDMVFGSGSVRTENLSKEAYTATAKNMDHGRKSEPCR